MRGSSLKLSSVLFLTDGNIHLIRDYVRGANFEKLTNRESYTLRVDRNHRILCQPTSTGRLKILDVGTHSNIYGD